MKEQIANCPVCESDFLLYFGIACNNCRMVFCDKQCLIEHDCEDYV